MATVNECWRQCQSIIKETINLKDSKMLDNEKEQIANKNSDTLKHMINDVITTIRQHLVLGYDRFYGIMLLDIKTDIDFIQQGAVDLDLRGNQITLKVNPYFLDGLTIQQFEALIVSELLLLCMDVPTKFSELNSERDPMKHQFLTLSASAVSMELTMSDIKVIQERNGTVRRGLKIPTDSYTVGDIRLDTSVNAANNKDLNYYYNLLMKHYKSKSESGKAQGLSTSDMPNYNPNLPTMPNNTNPNNKFSIHQWEDSSAKDDIHQKIKQLITNSYNSLSERERGLIPGSIQQFIDLIMAPSPIKWQEEIKSSFGSIRYGNIHTFTKPNRRQSDRLDIPGKRKDRLLKVVMVLDTSGSVSDQLLGMALNELYTILNTVKTEVTVIECDSSISKKPYIAKSPADIQTKMFGRGGTEFTPAINWINEHDYQNALLIFFTDGGGENKIPRPRVYKTIWLMPSKEYRLSVEEPYGKILYLDTDDKFKKY